MSDQSPPPADGENVALRLVEGMGGFSPQEWRGLTGTTSGSAGYNPFSSHAFLSSLEESGCVSDETGWLPRHLRLETGSGGLLGAIPTYVKSHSQGEYVFDHGWADAFERAGGHYYPKLQSCYPFTPANGPRLLVADGADEYRPLLAHGLRSACDQIGLSSAHVTFLQKADRTALLEAGFLERQDIQFHFPNRGYGTYDDFLATLASRKRKALKRERREALADNIEIEWLTGSDLTEEVWDDFHTFYMDTGSRKWGRPYLNREFWSLIGERMANDILLVIAKRDQRRIAGAINFIGCKTLFGRHWGCVEDHPFLHFELCYHQAIDYAIQHGLETVEAGAQGEHKLQRGYMPVLTRSAHYLRHGGLRQAIADYLDNERQDEAAIAALLERHSPYKADTMPDRKPG
ncbi:GNAT family N-acetyltransferase [Notoacmeibacter ruber]|uniref:N-acetyltransferase n=1 Tax=Notoacmeibacter ruber TaxID=2670375 RepID=A0A3L7JBY5_9HYPH|nr:GNAT family N-acetyltransferase [Notoacmeibacter ruber]RLQ87939.1 N-acetyltransferase [Notoacmeibacter ruber]